MKKFLKRTALILSCFCIAFSCTHIVNANSVSALLQATEKHKSTPDLEILINPVNYYFTTGASNKYDVDFVIEKRGDLIGAALPVDTITLSKDSTQTAVYYISANYTRVTMYGNSTENEKSNCVAGTLIYDSSKSSVQSEIDRINAELE